MDSPALYNPYDFANPVEDKLVFVGRKSELSEILYYLDHARLAPLPIHVALLGKRTSGKTSLLNMAAASAEQKGFCVVRLNLTEADAESPMTFLYRLYDAVVTSAFRGGAFGGLKSRNYENYLSYTNRFTLPAELDTGAFPLMFPVQYAMAMSSGHSSVHPSESLYASDLKSVAAELRKPTAIFIDEASVLAKSRIHLQCLRNIFMGMSRYLLILVGTPDLMPTIDDVYSPIARQFKKVAVGNFKTHQETETLIRAPLEKGNLIAEDYFDFADGRAIRDIHELTSGRPYEIQLVCHILFRRVQEGRATTMTLDYSALEEVRAELETSQDVTTRPIVTVVKSLDQRRLTVLSVITDCLGRASLDQLIAIEQVVAGRFEAAELKAAFDAFEAAQLVVTKTDGTIDFLGDEFDKIYIKYLSREFGIACEFSDLPLDQHLVFQMRRRHADLYNDFIVIRGGQDTMPLLDSFSETFSAMMDANNLEDLFLKRDALARVAYHQIIEFSGQPTLPAVGLRVEMPALSVSTAWFLASPRNLERFQQGLADIREMSQRATKAGYASCVEIRDFPVCSREVVLRRLKQTENARARSEVAAAHAEKMSSAFLAGDRAEAINQADLAYGLLADIPRKARTNVGYVYFCAGKLDRAEQMFEMDRASDFPPVYPGLTLYDLALLKALRGQYVEASICIDECLTALKRAHREMLICQSLQLAVIKDGHLSLSEVRYHAADLVRLATDARQTIQQLLSSAEAPGPTRRVT